jgi:hypothetical protein
MPDIAPRTFRQTLTGVRVRIDVWEEEGELDCVTGVKLKSTLTAANAIAYMKAHGGFGRWVEEP